MGNELDALKVDWGVYSSANNWQSIVGLDWTALSHKSLWWATYNGEAVSLQLDIRNKQIQNFNGFKPFGGWSKPSIHQYAGDASGPCGFKTDYNWYP